VRSHWLVALDFGTTATAAAVRDGDDVARTLVFSDGSSTVPSSVFAEGPGRLLVGDEADNEAEFRLDAYEPTPKRHISDEQVRLGDWDFQAPELIGAVLAPVLGEALRQHDNATPSQVVLTHPVAWRSSRRAALGEALDAAAAIVGAQLPQPTFVPEPVAAARWYAQADQPRDGEYFAIYDLGGGTFDTTVLRAAVDGFEVIASGGIDPLGGFDFDAALFTYLGGRYIADADAGLWSALSAAGSSDPEVSRQRRRLQQRVSLLKAGLSTSPDKRIQLPGLDGPVVVTRNEFESLIAGHIDDTIGELEQVIADAGITPDQLTAIYRIGGASRTPLIGACLHRLHVPVRVLDQPKLVVAQGAATRRHVTRPTAVPSKAVRPTEPAVDKQTSATTGRSASPPLTQPKRPTGTESTPANPQKSPGISATDRPAGKKPGHEPTGIQPRLIAVLAVTTLVGVIVAVIVIAAISSSDTSSTPSATAKHQYTPVTSDTATTTAYTGSGQVAQSQTPPSAVAAPAVAAPTLSDADSYGFINYPGARCIDNDQAIVLGRTAQSAIAICQSSNGHAYYRGYGLNNQLSVHIDDVTRSASGWTATNNGYLYSITTSGLAITAAGTTIQDEQWTEYWSG
jgi:Hsp70 protein